MNSKAIFFILAMVLGNPLYAQKTEAGFLFASNEPLELSLAYSFRMLSNNKIDSLYYPTFLYYKNGEESWDSIKVDLQARGNFRRNHCFYAPLRIEINKKESKGTLFEGHKSLKLVLPCETSKNNSDLVLKEYLCYQLYQSITPYSYRARLATINLTNLRDKQPKAYEVKAFFIENNGSLAKRVGGKMTKKIKTSPFLLQDTAAVRMDFFQFMIANTDWSMINQHNIRIVQTALNDKIPVPYDFDMSGFIDAPYSQVSEILPISHVRERLYRGLCRDEALMEYVRKDFILREPDIMDAFKSIETQINPRELPVMKKYIGEFFEILKDDRRYKSNILQKCRTIQ
jgi:hypothetical protein